MDRVASTHIFLAYGNTPADAEKIIKGIERLSLISPYPFEEVFHVVRILAVSVTNEPDTLLTIAQRYLEGKYSHNGGPAFYL